MDEQVKNVTSNLFWHSDNQEYIHSRQRVATTSLSDIVEFMSNKTIFADTHDVSNRDKKKHFNAKNSNWDSFKKEK